MTEGIGTAVNAHLPRILGVVRVGMHLHAGALRFDRHRKRRWLVLTGAALAADALIVGRLARNEPLRSGPWLALDAADLAAWSTGVEHPQDMRPLIIGDGWTHAALRAYLATVGQKAEPVISGTHAFPPRSGAEAARRLGEVLSTWVVPVAVTTLVHRAKGVRRSRQLILWPLLGALCGTVMGRVRATQHERAEEVWRRRSALGTHLTARSVRFEIVTGVDELHDLPRLLAVLGEHSETCRALSLESRDLPRRLVGDSTLGQPLGRALPYHEVAPAGARMLWLAPAEVEALTRGIEQAEAHPCDRSAEVLRLRERRRSTLVFDYLGHEVVVGSGPSLADFRFDPVAAGLLASATGKLVSCGPGRIPTPIGVLCAAIELGTAAATFRGGLTGRRHVEAVVAATLASSGLWMGATLFGGAEEVRAGVPVFPATGGTAALGPLAHYWPELPRWAKAGGGLVLLAWVGALRRRTVRPSLAQALAEAATVAQYFVATFGVAAATESEREALEQRLQAAHEEETAAVERETWRIELARYQSMVEVARAELVRLASEQRLGAADVGRLTRALEGTQRWIREARPSPLGAAP